MEASVRKDVNADPVIRMQDLRRTYRMGESEIHALDGVSLDVSRGEFLAIMGPSGSGKSTLMNMIGCLDRPNSGTYSLNGSAVDKLDDDALAEIRNREIGFVFQTFNLLPRLTAEQNVALPLAYARVDADERLGRARKMLEELGLGDRSDHRPDQLSGGQRQRVAIARALVHHPSLILADEPTGNLDSQTSVEIMQVLSDLHRRGNTIVLVTHEEETARHAQRVIVMRDGRIREERTHA